MELYLKEVSMENFKSFGKKLTVPFFPGFTAITGPNGSGKSNIADAILFVLGPKSSKTMRAVRLTDLIFNGGKKRKNPAKQCKVSLVFDNSLRKMPIDADEVTLTKMIKRAPLKDDPTNYYSYYYINGKSSTYTEFSTVLQQARISGDGYNIVKQGDITSIIEMGGVDRRRLIDEIAGIRTFDTDIDKAEKEEAEVDSNLERIKIIVREIDLQLKQLKKDRDEAARYNELKNQLYEIKAKIAEKKKQEIQKQIAEVTSQIQTYEKEQQQFSEQANTFKEQMKQKQSELESIEQQIADVGGDEVKEIKEQIDSIRGEEIKSEERINYANDEIKELNKDLQTYTQRLQQLETELQEIKKQSEEFNDSINIQQETIQQKELILKEIKDRIASTDDYSIDLSKKLTEIKEQFDDKNSKLHEEKLSLQRIIDQIETLENQIAEHEETKETYSFEIKDIEWQMSKGKEKNTEIKKMKQKLEQQLFQKKKQESTLSEQLQDLDHGIRRMQQEQSKLQAEHDAIASVQHKYNRAVTEILKARDNKELKGIHGTIAELAQVDDQYKTAMTIAAGSRMQSIIVEDDESAAKAIKMLQQKKLGRATFLPLNKMISGKPRGKALMVVKDPASSGFAIDLIHFQEEYRGAFWYVFGDTIVVDTLDNARKLMGGVRLVDLKGSLIEASGAMRGGSAPKTQLMFGEADRTKLDELTFKIKEMIDAQEQTEQQIQNIRRELMDIEQQLTAFNLENSEESSIQNLGIQQKEYTTKLENITKILEEKQKEKEQLLKDQDTLQQTINQLNEDLEILQKEKQEKGTLLLKGSNKEDAQQARTLTDEIEQLKETMRSQATEKEACEKKVELLLERKEEINEHIKEINTSLTNHKESITSLTEQRDTYQEKIQTLAHVQDQMSGKITQYTTKRDEIYKQVVSIEHDLDTINTRIESYYDLISRAKYRLPTFEGTIKEINEELKLYGITIDTKQLPSVDSLKDSLRVIEENMRDLEPVNMRALEEYNHQQQRKDKLDDDVKHLKDQRKNLIKLVKEVTDKKTERFYEVFHEINKNFQLMYAKLSEGGEAELQLENPDALFDSGLTIKARPRGKKVLLLSALSGGEKSIASLALIFAIQEYDPSPFYVLDEVDMFLDGVNAETVSRMVKHNAMDTQFIMVSLRKIALKEANHVYGVTMQDDGISDMIANIDPESVGPEGEIQTIMKG